MYPTRTASPAWTDDQATRRSGRRPAGQKRRGYILRRGRGSLLRAVTSMQKEQRVRSPLDAAVPAA
jgi:hypothetical protein